MKRIARQLYSVAREDLHDLAETLLQLRASEECSRWHDSDPEHATQVCDALRAQYLVLSQRVAEVQAPGWDLGRWKQLWVQYGAQANEDARLVLYLELEETQRWAAAQQPKVSEPFEDSDSFTLNPAAEYDFEVEPADPLGDEAFWRRRARR